MQNIIYHIYFMSKSELKLGQMPQYGIAHVKDMCI